MKRGTIDRQLGIETARKVRIEHPGPLGRWARDYEPTPPDIFEAMMSAVPLPEPPTTFVDLGAGKGRVLCLAAGRPFRAVFGWELSAALAQVARDNLARLDPGFVRAGQTACFAGDAGAFSPPPGPKVVFLYNPFGPPVLRRALEQLEAQRELSPEPMCLLYYEPVHAPTVDERPWLSRRAEAKHWLVWCSPEVP